jgi:hypothetical protein
MINENNIPSALNEGNSERTALARARARHLVIATSAAATGVFEPTRPILDATAQLAAAVAFDLEVAA